MEVRIETTYGATKKVAAGLEAFNREHQAGDAKVDDFPKPE